MKGDLNIINIKYYYKNNSKEFGAIKLFDNKFVENNKDKCLLIINHEQEQLSQYYFLGNIEKNIFWKKSQKFKNKDLFISKDDKELNVQIFILKHFSL